MRFLSPLILILTLILLSCGGSHDEEIEAQLATREEAIETKNVDLYMTLISPDYSVEKNNKVEDLETVKKKFMSNVALFDELEITNANRSIYERDGIVEVVQLIVVDALVSGTSKISGGTCNGQSLDLNYAKALTSMAADSSGVAAFNFKVPADFAGKPVHLQAYAETDSKCEISNRVTQIVQSKPSPSSPQTSTSAPTNPVLIGFSPNIAGQNNTLTVTGAPPGSTVFVKYSLNEGTKNRFKVNEKIQFSNIDGKWLIVKESDADFLERFVFGGSN